MRNNQRVLSILLPLVGLVCFVGLYPLYSNATSSQVQSGIELQGIQADTLSASHPQITSIDKRLAILESSKQDLSIWITIFVTSVTLLIALNIGLSVWQVGSIARREVEDTIKQFDHQFHGVLSDGSKAIDEKFASYDATLNTLIEKIKNIDSSSQKNIESVNQRIADFESETQKTFTKFKTEAEDIKRGLLNELENFYLKHKQKLGIDENGK